MRLTPIDLVKRRIKYVKNLLKWFTIGKVEMGKLRLLKPGLTRASTYSKDGKRTAGVWEYATQARYGLLSDYDWREGDKSMTAYYLRKFIVLVVTFSKDQKMVDATLTRCRRPGSGQIGDLRTQAGIDWPVVQAIHRSPSIDGWSWHPGGVVTQVNQLRQMGTQKILRGMSRYLRLARQYRLCRHRYDIDEKRILPLLRLLFVRKKGAPKALPWKIGVPDVILPKGNKDFPLFPLALSAQQPLLLINGYFRGGQPVGGLQTYIDDVRKHGVLRSSDLNPKASVAQAVDALVKTAAWKGLMSAKAQNRAGSWKRPARKINEKAFRTYHKVLLRAQALRAASPWPSTAQKKTINKRSKLAQSTFAKLRSDADWKQILKTASK